MADLREAASMALEALDGALSLAIGHAASYKFNHNLEDVHPTHEAILNAARVSIDALRAALAPDAAAPAESAEPSADSGESLIERLWAEADLCRAEGAVDVARLLDEAARELQSLEVQAFAGQAGQGHLGALVDELRAELAAAKREPLTDERDAARYRWLRDKADGEIVFDHTMRQDDGGHRFVLNVPFDGEPINNDAEAAERMDAAIDAQIDRGLQHRRKQ